MSETDVTKFVAHYSAPQGDSWDVAKAAWNQNALDAWLAAAREHGLEVTVREVLDGNGLIARVEVGGQEYGIHHLGRRMELEARPW
ncbi:hypothetical protein [Nocardia sp. NPDC051832]|uniref:hypothetical protein n=1 Tax=Nocardia sp. NPDC051832 TaxID=3155673 RepID=UPI00343E49E4